MGFQRYFDAIDRLACRLAGPSAEDRAAGLELAVASRRFSRRAKSVVDDKLSFSATLMRAGEVEAANRLLAEVERDVRTEEAALIEVVNEVKIEREMNRKPYTRLALARMLAAAMLGSTLLATSAVGMAVAGLFEQNPADVDPADGDVAIAAQRDRVRGMRLTARTKRVKIAGVPMNMTAAELDRFRELTSGNVDDERLETFLLALLPPELAAKVQLAIEAAYDVMPEEIEEPIIVLSERANEKRKEATEEPAEEASEEPSASPSPSDDDGSSQEPRDDDDEEGDSSGLPIVGDDDDDKGDD